MVFRFKPFYNFRKLMKQKIIYIFIGFYACTLLGSNLTGCAITPRNINNACAMLEENEGLFFSWRSDLRKVERKYHIPASVILATIHIESSFDAHAKPQRTKLWGFIPWKRRSTAYGYAQVLDGTWAHYQRASGNSFATRSSFSDAVDFIGWFHNESVRRNKIARNDVYALYLNYYMGQSGYAANKGQATLAIKQAARRAEKMARIYENQLKACPLY